MSRGLVYNTLLLRCCRSGFNSDVVACLPVDPNTNTHTFNHNFQRQKQVSMTAGNVTITVHRPTQGKTRFSIPQLSLHDNSRHRSCEDPEGGQGVPPPPPLENYKNIRFLSNIGPDSLKITKLPIQHSMLGHHRPASERSWRANSAIWILPPLIKL